MFWWSLVFWCRGELSDLSMCMGGMAGGSYSELQLIG